MISTPSVVLGPLGLAAVPGLNEVSLFLGGLILMLALMFHYLPNITRRDIFFAVTVDPAFRASAVARRILRQFRIAMWLNSIVAVGVVFAGAARENEWIPLIGILWQVATMVPAFLHARKQTMRHAVVATTHREAVLAPRSWGGVGFALLQLGPFAILGPCALYLRANWERIPERFPVHWGINGQPNGWATRSLSGVYGPLLAGAVICILLIALSYAILVSTRHVWASGPNARAESRFRNGQLGVLVLVEYFIAAIFSGVSLLPLRHDLNEIPGPGTIIVGTFVFLVAIIAVLIYTGQGGANLMKAGSEVDILGSEAIAGDRTPDQCWKAGMFYVNPDDPAILVEKRFGIGYTLNFGRPAAWILMMLILGIAVAGVLFAVLPGRPH